MKAAVTFLLVAIGVVGTHAGHHFKPWGYGETTEEALGPADWHKAYPHCGGNAQSPINIDTCKAKKSLLGYLKFSFTKVTIPPTRVVGTLTNNGHAPTLAIDRPKGTARISGGPVGVDTYELLQFHFHFGCKDGQGSEHSLNRNGKSGELHLVFYNTKYKSSEAAAKHDGLAVIGVFLKSGDSTTRPSLKKLIRTKITEIAKEGSSVAVTADDKITLAGLLPESAMKKFDYWTYKGSLTTPPCYQSVRWIVMKKKIQVSEEDLDRFRKLEAEHGFDGELMCHNNRPTMPLNGRTILTNES